MWIRKNIKDFICYKIAGLLPKKVMYYAIINAMARATTEKYTNLTPEKIGFSKLIEFYK